jgi:hypothetical protein
MKDNPAIHTPPKSLTTVCGLDDDAFKKYLEQKDLFLENLDQKAEARISAALEKKLSWVA